MRLDYFEERRRERYQVVPGYDFQFYSGIRRRVRVIIPTVVGAAPSLVKNHREKPDQPITTGLRGPVDSSSILYQISYFTSQLFENLNKVDRPLDVKYCKFC